MYQCRGIEIRPLPTHGDVKVRTSGAARAAAESYFLATFYLIAFLYFEFGKMKVEREESLSVVDYDAIAFVIQEARQ